MTRATLRFSPLLVVLLAGDAAAEAPNELATPSPHAAHAAEALGAGQRPTAWRAAGPPTRGPDAIVYGYKAYWTGTFADMPWDHLSHIALFSAGAETDGTLSNTSRWGDVAAARAAADPYGVRVHLCVTNFDREQLRTLLGSSTARNALITRLGTEVRTRGAHGVNIDFEGVPADRRTEMVTFIRDLQAEVGEVVVATPAVDWSNAWDFAGLTQHADLFIMGYGYHWSGSATAGPVDPLFGGGDFYDRSLDRTIRDYRTQGARPERMILGLPLYGYRWRTDSSSVPANSLGTGTSVVWTNAKSEAATHGARWHTASRTPWYFNGTEQVWHSSTQGVQDRTRHAIDAGIGGVGFWALNYDAFDPALWDAVRAETVFPENEPAPDEEDPLPDTDEPEDTGAEPTDPEDDAPFRANAGVPFLAYPKDIVILTGRASRGPAGVALEYDWQQLSGPPVTLEFFEVDRPRFVVGEPGVHRFSLRVGDGTTWSEPAFTEVIVLDRRAGRKFAGCNHGAPAGSGVGALTLLALAGIFRRRAVR